MSTASPARPYTSQDILFGLEGVNLRRELDVLKPTELARMTNVDRSLEGALVTRPGLTLFAQTFTQSDNPVHTMLRLDDPRTSQFTRIWGVGEDLFYGRAGTLIPAEEGFSGAPLSVVRHRPNLSALSYAYIADARKMRKINRLGAIQPIGLPAPAAALTSEIATDLRVDLDDFESVTPWIANSVGSSSASRAVDATDPKEGTNSVAFTAGVGTEVEGFTCFFARTLTADLSQFTTPLGTTREASDEDQIHLWLKVDKPAFVQEVRLYFILDSTAVTDTIPGTHATKNTQAYFTVFRPNLATQLIELEAFGTQAADETLIQRVLSNSLIRATRGQPTAGGRTGEEQTEEARLGVETTGTGRSQWIEYGRIGFPLRRGSFLRIGTDTTRDWSTVTGLVVLIRTNTDQTVVVNLDDLYFRGGYGVDSSDVGRVPFDYRYIHVDVSTGAKSNPSPIQEEEDFVEPVRQAVRLFPTAFGDANVRQAFYRRGGSQGDQWRLVGINGEDGGCALDVKSDSQILLGSVLQTDNDQPVTTEDETGAEVLAQPIRVIFGPISGHFFGCGDPLRPGFLYWSKFQEPDSWPAANNDDVCPPGEELMNGARYGNQGYVFSRERGYSILTQITNVTLVKVLPTQITRGLVSRYAIDVGAAGMYLVARDGVYLTNGGPQKDVSQNLRPLFQPDDGQTSVNGYAVIDFSAENDITLRVIGDDAVFRYRGVDGKIYVFLLSTPFSFWRAWEFGAVTGAAIFGEYRRANLQRWVGVDGGRAYELTGALDVTEALRSSVRTGTLTMGLPNRLKRWGQLTLEAAGEGVNFTVRARTEHETVVHDPVVFTSAAERKHYVLDVFPEDTEARDASIEISWDASSTVKPKLYHGNVSYIALPEESVKRATDWDYVGQMVDKRLKGVILDCNTFGQDKAVVIDVDGEPREELRVNTAGRRILHLSFPTIEGRLLRVRPRDPNGWQIYGLQWISDEEPLQLPLWETQWIDHGVPGYFSVPFFHTKLRATARVTYELHTRQQNGAERLLGPYDVVGPTGTDRQEQKIHVTLEAHKAVLCKHVLRSSEPFWVYREETYVFVQPWGADPFFAHPFGSDDLDLVRGLRSSAGVAAREGAPPRSDTR